MTRSAAFALVALAFSLSGWAQEPSTASPQAAGPPATGQTPVQRQKNAANAEKDTSGTSGDQITRPAGAKGSTLIGCLEGPDRDGKYLLRNMGHRMGVQVLGPDDLKNDSGSKVKLTGHWQAIPQPSEREKKAGEARRFQVTDIEVVAPTCKAPSETTPVSKNRRQKATTYAAPNNPKP